MEPQWNLPDDSVEAPPAGLHRRYPGMSVRGEAVQLAGPGEEARISHHGAKHTPPGHGIHHRDKIEFAQWGEDLHQRLTGQPSLVRPEHYLCTAIEAAITRVVGAMPSGGEVVPLKISRAGYSIARGLP
jgi:hypothetical protein